MFLTSDEIEKLLKSFHGFHDASYDGFELHPPATPSEKFSCKIALLAKDYSDGSTIRGVFHIDRLHEFQIRYNDNHDYPNIRDDIAIKMFDDRVYVDLGFAATEPQSPDDIRQSDIYFVGDGIKFEMAAINAPN